MKPHRLVVPLTAAGVLLPIAIAVLVGVGRLLAGLGDTAGAVAVDRVALGIGILWAIDLIVLLLAVAVETAEGREDRASSAESGLDEPPSEASQRP